MVFRMCLVIATGFGLVGGVAFILYCAAAWVAVLRRIRANLCGIWVSGFGMCLVMLVCGYWIVGNPRFK